MIFFVIEIFKKQMQRPLKSIIFSSKQICHTLSFGPL